MSCKNYRVLQMTNDSIGAVAADSFMPLGRITRRIGTKINDSTPFDVMSSSADTVQLTSAGYYKILYNATIVASAAGIAKLTLVVGGVDVYSASQTVASGATLNLMLPYDTRVFANCNTQPTNCPLPVQIRLSGVGASSGTANLIIDSCVNGG